MNEAAPPPRWAVVTWALLIMALLALLVFAQAYGERKRARELRTLLFADSRLSDDALASCLADRMPLTEKHWDTLEGPVSHIYRWNKVRGMRIDIINSGLSRRVIIGTPGGRPLYPQEAEALRRCLTGG